MTLPWYQPPRVRLGASACISLFKLDAFSWFEFGPYVLRLILFWILMAATVGVQNINIVAEVYSKPMAFAIASLHAPSASSVLPCSEHTT
jgi:hypothetical protein